MKRPIQPHTDPAGNRYTLLEDGRVEIVDSRGRYLYTIDPDEPRELDVPAVYYATAKNYAHANS